MGGDVMAAPAGKAPWFLVRALRDVDSANLDRLQIVKGWLDASGQTHEQVYDVAWSNAIGVPYLETYWRDPHFDPKLRAFYDGLVIEIPTPRWTTYDARFVGTKIPAGAPTAIQDRAYTTPTWYRPE
jgi:hypothetical protein